MCLLVNMCYHAPFQTHLYPSHNVQTFREYGTSLDEFGITRKRLIKIIDKWSFHEPFDKDKSEAKWFCTEKEKSDLINSFNTLELFSDKEWNGDLGCSFMGIKIEVMIWGGFLHRFGILGESGLTFQKVGSETHIIYNTYIAGTRDLGDQVCVEQLYVIPIRRIATRKDMEIGKI